jgi:hypothetical protein
MGNNKGVRPLAERRRHWLNIRQEGEDIIIKMHNTDIITYKPTGEVIIEQGGWNTSTTHEAIGSILSTTVFTKGSVGWITCANGTYPLRAEGKNVLRLGNGWVYENPVYPKVHYVNRKNLTNVRQRYKTFMDYAFNMAKLLGEDCHHDEQLCRAEGVPMYTDQRLCDAMLDEDNRYKAWLGLLRAADILIKSKRYGYGNHHSRILTEADLKATFTNTFYMAHPLEVFDAVEVRDGRVVIDKNWKYVRWAL